MRFTFHRQGQKGQRQVGGRSFDIIFVADARFPGGSSSALATEIGAAAGAGFRCGLLHVRGPVLSRPHPFHAAVRDALGRNEAEWVDPAARAVCRLAIVHHPMLLPREVERTRVAAERAVLVAHHPPTDGEGRRQYDIERQAESIEASFGALPDIAPVGPNVRARFNAPMLGRLTMLAADWHNLIDPAAWPAKPFTPFGRPIVIGRHARPDPLKWPDSRAAIFSAYPADRDIRVKILGAGPFLDDLAGPPPDNWELIAFNGAEPKAFLASLDAYVYFHSAKWVEAFGIGVLEALATGLVVILPPSFKPLFGAAAIYGEPQDVRDILGEFRDNPAAAEMQAKRARAAVEERFSTGRFGQRLKELYGLEPARTTAPEGPRLPASRGPRNVMFITSNGIGLGHLTRQIAIANCLNPWLRPTFFSLSRAVRLAREAGYLVEHASHHRAHGVDPKRWNEFLADDLVEAIVFHRPAALVFDGNVPYRGLTEALTTEPDVPAIWVRRGFWRDHHAGALRSARAFEAVIEPGEIAAADDFGPTRAERENVYPVPPILMIRPENRLPREEARAAFGIGEKRVAISLQLGAGNNFAFAAIRRALLQSLLARPEVDVVEFCSPISDEAAKAEPLGERHRIVNLYPSFRVSAAFDFSISAAGYNSFHENLLGAVPTIFVPNEAEEMDVQKARAAYAERRGLARLLRAHDVYGAGAAIADMLDWRTRAEMRRRCQALSFGDGAAEAARFIEETAYAARPARLSPGAG